jgi:2-polyprenyl-6-methoxyphenol hydroxylase-like FAD-dependent oxidoreductase
VGCADQLIQRGSRVETTHIGDRFSRIVTTDFSYLVPYTRYPFTLLIPQNVTEDVLGEQAKSRGVRVLRPHRVVAIKNNEHEDDILDVSFEDGGIIRAKYVIGADGAKSAVSDFCDPYGCHLLTFATSPELHRSAIWQVSALLILTALTSKAFFLRWF